MIDRFSLVDGIDAYVQTGCLPPDIARALGRLKLADRGDIVDGLGVWRNTYADEGQGGPVARIDLLANAVVTEQPDMRMLFGYLGRPVQVGRNTSLRTMKGPDGLLEGRHSYPIHPNEGHIIL